MVVNENCRAAVLLLAALSTLDAWASLVNARMTAREIAALRALISPRLVAWTVAGSPAAADHARAGAQRRIDDPAAGRIALSARDPDAAPEPVAEAGADQVAAVMFTSGTTGLPRAVMLSHRALIYAGATQTVSRRLSPADCLYVVAPVSHAIGLGSSVLAGLWSGAECLLVPRFDPAHLATSIADGRVSAMIAVPQVYAGLLDHAAANGITLSRGRLRVTGSGGAPVDPALKARMEATFGLSFGNAYGCTEISPIARVPDGATMAGTAVGLPQPGTEVRLVGEDGAPVAPGTTGEIHARGPAAMLGYFRDAAATAATMSPDGWVATGDLGRWDADGALHVVGRKKEIIIRSGFNVHPAEVEAALNACPGVARSAVVGVRCAGNDEVVAFVEPAAGASPDPEALRTLLRGELAAYKLPARIHVEPLPIGPTGKILKARLAARARQLAGA